jgi:ABC-type antimicrobial peptide transport system permease subunit
MKKGINFIREKVNGIIWALIGNGIFLLILAVLAVWSELFLRLIIGLFIVVIAFVFFYGAYKIYRIKKEVEKMFKLK